MSAPNTEYEQFTWKSDGRIFKGVGVYHLTFRVAADGLRMGTLVGRTKEEIADVVQPLLDAGEACDASNPKYVEAVWQMAKVELTDFGKAVEKDLGDFGKKHDGVQVCRKVVMDTHVHLVVWVQRNTGRSILQMAQGFRTGITQVAREMGVWPVAGATRPGENVDLTEGSVDMQQARDACPYHVFEKPFVRTLYANGQLQTMIDYVKLNPYRRWILVLHPELFKLHRQTRIAGLRFRSLGNHWLLDWPMRQMVECRRNTTLADWEAQLRSVKARAEAGAVTYTAAMNDGERYIYEHLRDAHLPVVRLLKDGFPPAGSPEENQYKPGGMLSDICSQGRLLLLEAYPESYTDGRIAEMTEHSLMRKAEEKHQYYTPLPHTTLRWRSIVCNEMMRLLSER